MLEKAPSVKLFNEAINAMQNLHYTSLISTINEKYLYWDEVKYKVKGDDAEAMWGAVKFSRVLISSAITFGNYKFSFASTQYIQKVLHELDLNIGGSLGAQDLIPEQDKNRYLVSSIMEEAISSSRIEGANTTREKAKEMLRKEIKPKNKSEQMIVNNYNTINHIVQNKSDELTIEKLLHIHQLVSRNTLENSNDEGHFRDNNDIYVVNHSTSEVVHTPPDFEEILPLMNDLCRFFNQEDDNPFIHPIVKGIIIHFMIGWIHPFTDGNGRTARSLFYWYLLKKGYWLTEYLSISRIIQQSKNQYEKAYLYTEADDNDLTYFVLYNLKAMKKAFDALKEYLHKKQKESQLVNKFLRIPTINERQAIILQLLAEEPDIILNVKEIENRMAVSEVTARFDLNALVKLGFMDEIRVNKVKRNYVKSNRYDQLIENYIK